MTKVLALGVKIIKNKDSFEFGALKPHEGRGRINGGVYVKELKYTDEFKLKRTEEDVDVYI